MTEHDPRQRDIEELIRKRFMFLKIDKRFTKPIIHTSLGGFIFRSDIIKIAIETDFFMSGTVNIAIEKMEPKASTKVEAKPRRVKWNLLGLLTRRLQVQDERIDTLIHDMNQHQRLGGSFPRVDLERDAPFIIDLLERYHDLLADYIDLILRQPLDILFPTELEYMPVWSARELIQQYAIDQFSFLQERGFADAAVEAIGGNTFITWIRHDLGIRMSFL